MPEKLRFRISSALKDVIGRDLATDDFVAVFELVKNSSDAFSENIIIRFDLEKGSDGKIYIVDDGKGMSRNDLLEKWLFVGFSAKKNGTEDEIKRTYAGNKGVGRFSCDRLGSILKIQSKTEFDSTIHCLDINWEDFEVNSKDEFIEIDVNYSERESFSLPQGLPVNNSGVVLEISNLRNELSWNRDKLLRLKRSIEKLIDPVPYVETSKKIQIECKSEKDNDMTAVTKAQEKEGEAITVNGSIENTIFQILENKTTVLRAKITRKNKLQVELIDRGVFIYKTEENICDSYPQLIDSDLYAELLFLNTSAKVTFARRMGIPSVRYGSLFLIRNGFRVFPIGEEGNDYWGFDRRKQQGYARYLGSRELLGFAKVQGDEDKFREASSRNQGLIQTQAAIELSDCVKRCIIKFEAYVADIAWKDKLDNDNSVFERMGLDSNRLRIIQLIEKLSKSKNIEVLDFNHDLVSILSEKAKEFEPSLKNLKNIANSINDEKLIKQIALAEKALLKAKQAEYKAQKAADQEKKARKKAEDIAKTAAAKAKKAVKEKNKIEDAYKEEKKRNLFLTGSNSRDKDLLEGFMHQIVLYASLSKGHLQNVLKSSHRFEKMTGENLRELLEELLETTEKIVSTSRLAISANFRLDSSMITEDFNSFLYEYLEKVAAAYNSRIKIHPKLEDKKFELRFNPIEMGMVLENFISNSKTAGAPNITFTSTLKSNILKLVIEDDGKGLDKRIIEKERIFEKGFTRTSGSGLGLYFCKKRIENLGGELKLSELQPKRGISFTIRVVKQ
ncbi:ATP-binding protein [Desulfococcaceae bacterium HSG8]|nr:ATP-binding protein [Desulfococcaceae bacterium HSG8]